MRLTAEISLLIVQFRCFRNASQRVALLAIHTQKKAFPCVPHRVQVSSNATLTVGWRREKKMETGKSRTSKQEFKKQHKQESEILFSNKNLDINNSI